MRSYLEKVFSDYFYKETYHYLGMRALAPAGFLYDENPLDTTLLEQNQKINNIYNVDLHKIINQIEKHLLKNIEKKAYVLLSTGSFNPVHDGHIKMLELAREELEKNNQWVIGGVLSPSHDKYVFTKDTRYEITASQRAWLCHEKLEKNEWISVDTWEALENDYPINFTDVILRLEWLLNERLKKYNVDIKVVYVFGSDNYTFIDAFISKGSCVCVPRKEEDIPKCLIRRQQIIDFKIDNPDKRILIAQLSENISSTTIRDNGFKNFNNKKDNILPYLIRDDILESTLIYSNKIKNSHESIQKAKESLISIFSNYFQQVKILKLEDFKTIVNEDNIPIVNLDTWIHLENEYSLRVSRVFHINTSQKYSQELYFNESQQLELINNQNFNHYILVDDDIASGFTTNTIKQILNPKKCVKIHSLNPYHDFFDIVDIRDFILGSQYGGLLCINPLNQNKMRVPYIFPFINLFSWAKLPHSQEIEFSQEILKINETLFKESTVQIKDTDEGFQNFCEFINISKEEYMVNVINQLQKKYPN